ncbi:MAG: ABC transporter ATP-binding protein [Chloroflexota bacterium]|nr:ABC transporter ATP-binding protein [Chloroflexota bacterium]
MSVAAAVSTDVLRVNNLRVYYRTDRGPLKAVDGVSFSLRQGERFGLVGESGSGKSTTALAIMRLIQPPGRIEGGAIHLGERDLTQLSEEQFRQVRLADIALIPQGAMNSLNPVRRVRDHFFDSIRAHERGTTDGAIRERINELLRMVGLREEAAHLYPHELSGGMKQRVCIALGIALQPKVIIADEPTSALDVVVQRHVMQTLGAVQQRLGASVILVGHDMGLLAQFVDRLGVMYAGKLVEIGPVREIFQEPLHPYTQLLIASLPSLTEKGVFRGVPGLAPSLLHPPTGCLFHPRCPRAMDRCAVEIPELQEVRSDHWVACHLY